MLEWYRPQHKHLPEPGDPDVTNVHYNTGTISLEKTEDTSAYTLMFDHLRATALATRPSSDLIERARADLRPEGGK